MTIPPQSRAEFNKSFRRWQPDGLYDAAHLRDPAALRVLIAARRVLREKSASAWSEWREAVDEFRKG